MSARALQALHALVRKEDPERYMCALFASGSAQQRLLTLYAVNAEISKIPYVTADPMAGYVRLQWWRDAISAISHGKNLPPHELVQALAQIARERPVSWERMEMMIDAREGDIDRRVFPDEAALEAYVEQTSCALLWLALEMLGIDDAATREAAYEVGKAWGITGILRSSAWHWADARMVLPQSLLSKNNLRRDDYGSRVFAERHCNVVQPLVLRSRAYIQSARKCEYDRKALPVLLLGTLADHYLTLMERSRYDVLRSDLERHRLRRTLSLFYHAWRKKF